MTNFKDWTAAQWISVAMFVTVTLATAGWWQDVVDVKTASTISGALVWVGSVLNFLLTGKMPDLPPAAK